MVYVLTMGLIWLTKTWKRCYLQEHGVSHFTGAISHPASTGLLERAVQEMLALISKKCIKRGTTLRENDPLTRPSWFF